jgi:hypothetical protein
MKYAVGMGPGAMIYIPSFTKIGSAVHNLLWGYTDIKARRRPHKPN